MSDEDHDKVRLNYAWDWFVYHAGQRITLFNYYLIITGILSNGYIGLVREDKWFLAGMLTLSGSIISLGFLSLESRNRELEYFAGDILAALEEDVYFKSDYVKGNQKRKGMISRVRDEDQNKKGIHWPTRHKIWIPLIEGSIALGFFIVSLLSFYQSTLPSLGR